MNINGLTQKELVFFMELLKKANTQQIKKIIIPEVKNEYNNRVLK